MVARLHPLRRKLLRELLRLWPQVLAIALVMASGVATLIIGAGTYASLSESRNAFYRSHHFADLFATATRAPRSLLPQIAAVPGVAEADGRIAALLSADVPGMDAPANLIAVSLPAGGAATGLNRLYLKSGRLPVTGHAGEVALAEAFASNNGLRVGDRLSALIGGMRRTFTVVGIAISPEYIYAVAPGQIIPDRKRFGVLWMGEDDLAGALDLTGAFTALAVKLVPGADADRATAAIDRLLEPYGGSGSQPRKNQMSHAYLDAELTQLQMLAGVLPPIFLLVSALLVNVTLARLIAVEREQIGLMRALGYTRSAIAWHYLAFALVIAVIGLAIGGVAGLWLGNGLTRLYTRYFSFPALLFTQSPGPIAAAVAVTVGSTVFGALRAVIGAAALPPAIAMQPPAPPSYKHAAGGGLGGLVRFRQTTVMALRHLLHWPLRTLGGVVGIALAVAILVGSLWSTAAIEALVDFTFGRTNLASANLTFDGPRAQSALFAVQHLPGVMRAEPYRVLGVELSSRQVERRVPIYGRPAETQLSALVGVDGRQQKLLAEGVILSAGLAQILGVEAGETVRARRVEGDGQVVTLRVAAVNESFMGLSATMESGALRRAFQDGERISGADLLVDASRMGELYAALKATPSAGQVALKSTLLNQFRETMAQNMWVMIAVLVGLAAVIALGVVYNFARVSLSEQGRELASLRVLGFHRGEVTAVLFLEIFSIVILAQPVGWLLGAAIANGMVAGYSSELYRMPLLLMPDTFAISSAVVLAVAFASWFLVRRRVRRLDMIAVLKTRE